MTVTFIIRFSLNKCFAGNKAFVSTVAWSVLHIVWKRAWEACRNANMRSMQECKHEKHAGIKAWEACRNASMRRRQDCKHEKHAGMQAWEACRNAKHEKHAGMQAWEACRNTSMRSMKECKHEKHAGMQAWEACRNASMKSMQECKHEKHAGMQAWEACSNASMRSMQEYKHEKHAGICAWEACSNAIMIIKLTEQIFWIWFVYLVSITIIGCWEKMLFSIVFCIIMVKKLVKYFNSLFWLSNYYVELFQWFLLSSNY